MSRGECPISTPECKYAPKCFSDDHHYYWPANQYRTEAEKQFRQHRDNREQLCRVEHEAYHDMPPPLKPSEFEMRLFLGKLSTDEVA